MDPLIISGIVGAAASLFGGLVNNKYAEMRSDEQFRQSNYLMDKANAYNAPKAQMQRLKEAGLNPNLVYQNGGTVVQSAVGSAAQQPTTQPLDMSGVLELVRTVAQSELQNKQIASQEKMQKEQLATQERMQQSLLDNQKEMQSNQIQADDKRQDKQLEFSREDLKERTRQFNERIGLDKLIEQHNYELQKKGLSIQQARLRIEQSQVRYANALANLALKREANEYVMSQVESYLTMPYSFTGYEVYDFMTGLGFDITLAQANEMAASHNDLVEAGAISADISSTKFVRWWSALFAPAKQVISTVSSVVTKKPK